jgi:hypothetical protein
MQESRASLCYWNCGESVRWTGRTTPVLTERRAPDRPGDLAVSPAIPHADPSETWAFPAGIIVPLSPTVILGTP